MFGNAMVYNPKGSDVYVMAATLKKFAVKELQHILADQQLRRSDGGTPRTRHSILKQQKALDIPGNQQASQAGDGSKPRNEKGKHQPRKPKTRATFSG